MLPLTEPDAKPSPRSQRRERWRLLLLALLSSLIWVAHAHKWTWAEWQTPTDYASDAMEILARIKIASEGDTLPLISQRSERLGAPIGAIWNAYPTPEKAILLVLGAIARVSNVFVAANAGLLLAQLLNALAFYWVVRRWLWVRWEWAMTGALLFACTYSTFHRGLAHYFFFVTWVVPLGLLACWLVARSSRLHWHSPGAVACLVAGFALGCHTPYYLYFWLPLMGWAWVTQWLGPRRRSNLQIGAATVAVSLALFFVMNFEYWFHVQSTDAMPLLERNYGGTERFALKPIEMFIPPLFHNWDVLAFFGSRYNRWSEWRGEVFLPYLGLTGIVAFLWLIGRTIRLLLIRRPPPGEFLALGWIVSFATVGGLTNVISFFGGLTVFRATNRIVIFIMAIVLIFLVVRLSRLTAHWRASWRLGAALALAAFGVADQLPRTESLAVRQAYAAQVKNDKIYGQTLEQIFPAHSMIFQLPVVRFPEVVAPVTLGSYEHFRPFLHTDTLRFSYGATKFRPRERWQQDLPLGNTARLVRELESYGFAGLYLNRKGFPDQAESLLKELRHLGYTEQWASASAQQVVIKLNPTPMPLLPLARTLTAGKGWHLQIRDGVRWAYEPTAILLYQNPYPEDVTVDLALKLTTPGDVALYQNGSKLGELKGAHEQHEWQIKNIRLQSEINTFELRSTITPQRAPAGYLRGFGLLRSTVTRVTPSH